MGPPPEELVIDVTQADIDCGVRGDANQCAVSVAVRRILAPVLGADWAERDQAVVVGPVDDEVSPEILVDWWGYAPHCLAEYEAPEIMAWLFQFDWGHVVEPFKFTARLRKAADVPAPA